MRRPTDGTQRRNKGSLGNRMQILERIAAASNQLASARVGHSRPNRAVRAMSGLPPPATELRTSLMVRFVPTADLLLPDDL